MQTPAAPTAAMPSRARRFFLFPLTRIVLATFATALAGGLSLTWLCELAKRYFSVAVSGHEARGLLSGRLSGPDWITGGAYGFEASVATLLVLGLVAVALLRAAWTRGRFVAPAWRRRGAMTPSPATTA